MARGKATVTAPVRPALTVDVVVFTIQRGALWTLLIRRRRPPFAGQWAFPGGFVEPNEPLEAAARRELAEETGLTPLELWPMQAFGDPGRDPRGWTVTAAYYALQPVERSILRAGDDAKQADWKRVNRPPRLAFDHKLMLQRALARMRGEIYTLPIARTLLPAEFGLDALQQCYAVLDTASASAPAVLPRRLIDAKLLERRDARRDYFRFRAPKC